MKKVEWPSKQQVYKATLLVFAISVIVGAFLGGLDLGFTKIFSIIIK